MLEVFKQAIANQFEAAFCTLNACIDRCPNALWNVKIGRYPLSQVAFHTLFYADFYLGQDEESFRHIQHHAAQLSLRLRLDAGLNVPWIGSSWRELSA